MKVTEQTPPNLLLAELEHHLKGLSSQCHDWCVRAGFDDDMDSEDMRDVGIKGALIAAEGIELFETSRKDPRAPCEKTPLLTCEGEEVADVFLRLLDYCGWRGINLLEVARIKHQVNIERAHVRRYGKNF